MENIVQKGKVCDLTSIVKLCWARQDASEASMSRLARQFGFYEVFVASWGDKKHVWLNLEYYRRNFGSEVEKSTCLICSSSFML